MNDPSQLPSVLALGATALAAGVLSAGGLLAYSVFVPRCQFWASVVRSIPQRDAVALTFDDGPDQRFTPQILDHLAARGVKASFFVIGQLARRHPALVRRIHREGHVLGNHSLDHDHFGVNGNRAYWRKQIADTQQIVGDIVGMPPYLFRPPMGFKTWHIAGAARELGLPIIGWSVRAFDTQARDPANLTSRLLRCLGGHDILTLHDGIEPGRRGGSQQHTADALPGLLAGLAAKNLRALTLVEALLPAAAAPEIGATP